MDDFTKKRNNCAGAWKYINSHPFFCKLRQVDRRTNIELTNNPTDGRGQGSYTSNEDERKGDLTIVCPIIAT